jgi:hypothetical protein
VIAADDPVHGLYRGAGYASGRTLYQKRLGP